MDGRQAEQGLLGNPLGSERQDSRGNAYVEHAKGHVAREMHRHPRCQIHLGAGATIHVEPAA